jgi:hypothetical protein
MVGIGWIPSLDCHLSFTLLGRGTSPLTERQIYGVEQTYNGRAITGQRIVAMQHRINRDIPSNERRSRPGTQRDYLLMGETAPACYHDSDEKRLGYVEDWGVLRGSILLLPHQDVPSAAAVLAKESDRMRVALQPRLVHRVGTPDWRQLYDDAPIRLKDAKVGFIEVEFAIYRTGEARLWFVDPSKLLPTTEELSLSESAAHKKIEEAQEILRHVYYFAKDAFHRHNHHDGESDQILPFVVGPASIAPGEADQLEVSWQNETLWAMARHIDSKQRTANAESLRQTLGVMCYAESFQKNIYGNVRTSDDTNHFVKNETSHPYEFSCVRESIKIDLDRRLWLLPFVTAIFFGSIAATLASISMVNSFKVEADQVSWPARIVEFIRACPLAPTLTVLTICGMFSLHVLKVLGVLRPFFVPQAYVAKYLRGLATDLLDPVTNRYRDWIGVVIASGAMLVIAGAIIAAVVVLIVLAR